MADLRHRGIDFDVPADPLSDTAWILLLKRVLCSCNGHCRRVMGESEIVREGADVTCNGN